MAQTLTPAFPPGMGWSDKLKFHVFRLASTAGETSYTLTAALAGMTLIAGAWAIDESAAAAIRGNPTVDAATGFYTQVAFTFTAGDELSILVVGV